MLDKAVKLPCGADLIVSQTDPGQYLLLHFVVPTPMDKFMRINADQERTKITVGIDPDNLPYLRDILQETQAGKSKLQRILDILRES